MGNALLDAPQFHGELLSASVHSPPVLLKEGGVYEVFLRFLARIGRTRDILPELETSFATRLSNIIGRMIAFCSPATIDLTMKMQKISRRNFFNQPSPPARSAAVGGHIHGARLVGLQRIRNQRDPHRAFNFTPSVETCGKTRRLSGKVAQLGFKGVEFARLPIPGRGPSKFVCDG